MCIFTSCFSCFMFFFFKQKTAYEMRISDWSSDVCSSDLHTHFANPVGLDSPGNYSSATDLVKMALILRTNAFIRETVDKPKVTLQSGAKKRTLKNRNTLIGKIPYINGVKTGHTQSAGYVLVGSASRKGVTFVRSEEHTS